ncbi:MAG: exodeoxyribonuclease VII small subunit [Oscillospiraceae bacterium]|nr:exodeoxyribonuclease VII small subunit [Oscillospiraceae bacterium]
MQEQSKSFEQAVGRLEEIVKRMESGSLPLEEALSLFQEGAGLVQLGTKLLDDAELQVAKLGVTAGGTPEEMEWNENG